MTVKELNTVWCSNTKRWYVDCNTNKKINKKNLQSFMDRKVINIKVDMLGNTIIYII
jgi:hypothetical protein